MLYSYNGNLPCGNFCRRNIHKASIAINSICSKTFTQVRINIYSTGLKYPDIYETYFLRIYFPDFISQTNLFNRLYIC